MAGFPSINMDDLRVMLHHGKALVYAIESDSDHAHVETLSCDFPAWSGVILLDTADVKAIQARLGVEVPVFPAGSDGADTDDVLSVLRAANALAEDRWRASEGSR